MVSAVMLTAFTAYVHAQDPIRIELADISIGTGLEDGRLCALMSESFLESDEGLSLVERMNSCLTDNSYREMASQMKNNLESLTESRKQYEGKTDETSREILSALDENIARCKELIGQYSSNSDGAADATALLEEIRSHSLGGRLYYGADDIGHGYWAVGTTKGYRTPDSRCGVIDSNGNVAVPFIYNCLEAYPDTRILRTIDCSNNKEGAIRYDGSVILDCKYDIVNMCSSALIIIDNEGNESRCGVADLNGNIVLPQIYKEIEPFSYGLESGTYDFYVITDNKTRLKAVFDNKFKQITGFIYDGWLNEKPYFIGVKPAGDNDIYDARSWQKLTDIPEDYWNHRHSES